MSKQQSTQCPPIGNRGEQKMNEAFLWVLRTAGMRVLCHHNIESEFCESLCLLAKEVCAALFHNSLESTFWLTACYSSWYWSSYKFPKLCGTFILRVYIFLVVHFDLDSRGIIIKFTVERTNNPFLFHYLINYIYFLYLSHLSQWRCILPLWSILSHTLPNSFDSTLKLSCLSVISFTLSVSPVSCAFL